MLEIGDLSVPVLPRVEGRRERRRGHPVDEVLPPSLAGVHVAIEVHVFAVRGYDGKRQRVLVGAVSAVVLERSPEDILTDVLSILLEIAGRVDIPVRDAGIQRIAIGVHDRGNVAVEAKTAE